METIFFNAIPITTTCILVMLLLLLITVSWIRIIERKEDAANRNKELGRKKTIDSRIYKEVKGGLGAVIVLLIIINKSQINIATHVLFAIVMAFYFYDVYKGVVTHDERKKFWGLFAIVSLVLLYVFAAYSYCVRCS